MQSLAAPGRRRFRRAPPVDVSESPVGMFGRHPRAVTIPFVVRVPAGAAVLPIVEAFGRARGASHAASR